MEDLRQLVEVYLQRDEEAQRWALTQDDSA